MQLPAKTPRAPLSSAGGPVHSHCQDRRTPTHAEPIRNMRIFICLTVTEAFVLNYHWALIIDDTDQCVYTMLMNNQTQSTASNTQRPKVSPRTSQVWGGRVSRSLKNKWWPEGTLELTQDNRIRFQTKAENSDQMELQFDVTPDQILSFVSNTGSPSLTEADITLRDGGRYQVSFNNPLSLNSAEKLAMTVAGSVARTDGAIGYAVGNKVIEKTADSDAATELRWWEDAIASFTPVGQAQYAPNMPALKWYFQVIIYVLVLSIVTGVVIYKSAGLGIGLGFIVGTVVFLLWCFQTQAGRAYLYMNGGAGAFNLPKTADGRSLPINREYATSKAPDFGIKFVLKLIAVISIASLLGIVTYAVTVALLTL